MTAQAADSPPQPRLSFNRDIRPILSENCFACHGPDNANRRAALRLDSFEAATAELDGGTRAIVPENIDESEIIARIISDDPDTVMPPPEAKIGRLSAEQVDTIKRWIAEGAKYEPHWAFVPPQRPAAADASAAIDEIVANKLAHRHLGPRPEADKATLIRRASFDITGLPPTLAEVEAFLADASPDAYEKLLDRLLASPRFGERMAADWLDLARYSDSFGFQVDFPRPTMWPWRDWVIESFNNNLPWDQFVLWQLAGDLLPGATSEQIMATAFNRLHQQETEGGSIEEEYRVNYVNDRVTTFGTAFLGLTLECCRCHDHKFDPLSQKEFYQLFAFFDDIDEAGLYSWMVKSVPTPKMRLPDPLGEAEVARADAACSVAAANVAAADATARAAVADWIAGKAPMPAAFADDRAGTIPGERFRYSFDERRPDARFANLVAPPAPPAPPLEPAKPSEEKKAEAKPAPDADGSAFAPTANSLVEGRAGKAIQLTGNDPVNTAAGGFRRSQPFTIATWLKSPEVKDRAVVFHQSIGWIDAGSRGYDLVIEGGRLRWSFSYAWPGDAMSIRTVDRLPVDEWVHLAAWNDGSGRAAGLKIFVNGKQALTEVVRDVLTRDILDESWNQVYPGFGMFVAAGRKIRIGERIYDRGLKDGCIDDFRVFDRALAPLEIREIVEPGTIRRAIVEKADAESLGGYFTAAFAEDVMVKRQALQQARQDRDDLAVKSSREIMVMKELPQPKVAYVLERGEYDKRREQVDPGTPATLPPFPANQPRNRLGLARWLIDPEHPLLARVTVNRLWTGLFGVGLVQSPEDLGSQSILPEYPEVLDLLAWKFSHPVTDGGFGWNMKRLMKSIMLSKTYRQGSTADEKTMADDPLNLWLARGPRHRLPAEMIRDGALAACGLLVEKMGGPPVNTYDLPDSFKPEPAHKGEALYRRSLYTYWRRTGPAPMLESFDVPKRLVCVAKRDTTNTPLHAFVLMNGPQFVEAARVLAERLLVEHAGRTDDCVDRAFYLLTNRQPDEEEKRIIRRMLAEQVEWYTARPKKAEEFVTIGDMKRNLALSVADVAALAAVVNTLLNYDGMVVKR